MNIRKTVSGVFIFAIFISTCAAQPVPPAKTAIASLEKDIPELLRKADVPGMSIGLIRDGKVAWIGEFGITNSKTKKKVYRSTVFEAASLSKPVFAYAILKLADEGKLNLDTPLNSYLGTTYDVVGDDRINKITARHVLSHTSGFPNWRPNGSATLPILFEPGLKFSYSGEGMVYLSKVAEKITGLRFEEFMQQYALRPLGMKSSSYIWQNAYDSLKVYHHDLLGNFSGRNQPSGGRSGKTPETGNAAASLVTNADDYSKFIVALLNGTGLKKTTWEMMLTPQVRVNAKFPPVAWGLGIGLETMPEGAYAWHWGDNGDSKAYLTAFLPGKDAVVYFADGANGLSFTREILRDAMGGNHPAVDHLDYESYNSPSRLLLKSLLAGDATQALGQYRSSRGKDSTKWISEEKMNDFGYTLLHLEEGDKALAVFKQNTDDFPESWNAWDSYAEMWMKKGNKELAIKYYEKSIALNPENTNGKEQLKKLKK